MAKSTANIVTLNFGLNDAYFFSKPEPGKGSSSPQEFKTLMREIVQIARDSGKLVVIYEPNPSCHPARESSMPYYVMHLDQVGKEMNAPVVSQFWTLLADPNWRELVSDCTHPTPKLYQLKGENAYQTLRPIVRQIIDAE